MKRRPPHRLLPLLNLYNLCLVAYLALRCLVGTQWWWLNLLNTFALWLFAPLLLILPLALLLRGRRTAGMSLLLTLIALLRFAPLPTFTQSDTVHDLRVLTFNVWGINQQIDRSIDWVLEQDADVVILQEFIDGHLTRLPRLLEQYPHQAYVVGNVRLFSRYPFAESETIWVEDATVLREGRLAVRTVINVDGQLVTVYGVHLSLPIGEHSHLPVSTGSGLLDFVLRYDETRRNSQIHNLAERVAAETNPVILAGDFNTSHTSPILDELRQLDLRDSFAEVGNDWGMTWYQTPSTLAILRIDYIWATSDLQPLRYVRGSFLGSDHLPIVVDYSFNSAE